MSSDKTKVEEFIKLSHDVIATTHPIMIRYHRFQDDYRDEPLSIGSHCYIVFNDKRHEPYLVSAIIKEVDKSHMIYTIQRTNDNEMEKYRWHQIVVTYNKNIHSINIEQHKQSIQTQNSKKKIKAPKNKNKRKRKRDENDTDNIETNENNIDDQNRPNKKRKLNDLTASNINNNVPDNNNNNRPDHGVLSIAQPYFPIPHPYFRQNALLKWKGKDYREYQDRKEVNLLNPDNDWEVGRIVDFDMERDIVYIQNTYRCGTKDEEDTELLQVNWTQFQSQTCAQFIEDLYLFQLKQPILYWWDRPGCGSVCPDTVQSLDYGADNDLLYGITGDNKKRPKSYKEEQLKWVHKDGLFQPTDQNKTIMSKYISRNKSVEGPFSSHSTTKIKKLFDVIIIGAGMAGLTTRWALHNTNTDYTLKILEAQDYIGGRLKPHKFPAKTVCDPHHNTYKLPEVSVELGAAFLSGSGKDNRFWTWLQKKQRHICADWGGYNNGWWNGASFIDSSLGVFVSPVIIERIKNICDDIQILCCKLLMPLCDMSVVDGLEYLRVRIPSEQLFGKESVDMRSEVEKYFYHVYDKYKILSANWVGEQGLWQQQQTVELQNLDFEALYRFLRQVFGGNRKGKRWLGATEKLIMDYYGDKTNIKTQNFDVYAERKQYDDDEEVVMNGKVEVDSEATESENDHSVTLSPLLEATKTPNNAMNCEFKASAHVNWTEIVKYDVSDYHGAVYQYKFGFRDVLVRDIIHPPHEEEASEFEKTTGLSSIEYERFKNALQHLADCNLFSYHLYFLRCDVKWSQNVKVQQLLDRFKEDLSLFDTAIEDFKKILSGKILDENIHKPQVYHTNRKTKIFQIQSTNSKKNEIQLNGEHKKEEIVNNMEKKEDFLTMLPKLESIEKKDSVIQDVITQNMYAQNSIKKLTNPTENDSNEGKRRHREHKKHKKHKKHHKKHKKHHKKCKKQSSHDLIEQEFKQDKFDPNLCLNPHSTTIGDGFVPNGYSQVLEPFLVDTNNKNIINLNHQVTSIERIYNDKFGELSEIRGIDLKSSKPFTYWSRFVSVAVPLGILKLSLNCGKENNHSGIKFKPFLSVEKKEAITAMGMGCENKVYLRFTKCFWPRDKPYFQSIQHPEYRFINLSYCGFALPVNTNVLCTMIPPTMGKKWYWQHPAQELRIVWDVLRVLNQMFKVRENGNDDMVVVDNEEKKVENINGHVSDLQRECVLLNDTEEICELLQMLVDYKVTDWEHNIFTRGSYSYLPKGAIYTHCKALQKYDGNGVYFCGEATSIEGFECVDGAHETGFKVAKEIHKQLQKSRY